MTTWTSNWGDVRTKREGGDAGHKGVRSILSGLGTGAIHRVRVGVRRPGDARKARAIVLQPFLPDEEAALVPALERAVSLVQTSVTACRPDTATAAGHGFAGGEVQGGT